MKKLMIIVVAMVMVFSGVNAAMATFGKCPPGQERKGWKCVDIEPGVIVNNDVDTDIKNINKNVVDTDVDVNVKNNNLNIQGQKQDQDQKQIQGQGQSQSTENSNNATQETNITFKSPRVYNHISGTAVSSEAKLSSNGEFDAIRTYGGLPFNTYTTAQVLMGSKSGDDMDVVVAVIGKAPATRSIELAEDSDGEIMGMIYVTSDGDESNMIAADSLAMKAAMKIGATALVPMASDKMVISEGSSWNIGTGGGTSVSPQDSGRLMVTGTGGVGFGRLCCIL
jgi:hypothetical protein